MSPATATSERAAGAPAQSTTASAIYRGTVTHRRLAPVEHAFSYPVFMPLLDLDELPELLDRFDWWTARPGGVSPVRFDAGDHLEAKGRPLAEVARDLCEAELGKRPPGPVRLLTNPRYLGFGFNPVSFFFLYGEGGAEVEALIAEVTNTPWGERRSYVLEPEGGSLEGSFEKALHVSPFMEMDQSYRWSAVAPGERLSVSLTNHQEGERVFEAYVSLRRSEMTPARMKRLLLSYPPMTFATVLRIYWQALRLKLKGLPFVAHPNRGADQ